MQNRQNQKFVPSHFVAVMLQSALFFEFASLLLFARILRFEVGEYEHGLKSLGWQCENVRSLRKIDTSGAKQEKSAAVQLCAEILLFEVGPRRFHLGRWVQLFRTSR